jgi:hypothetical protein
MLSRVVVLGALLLCACDRPRDPDPRQMASRALQGALSYPQSSVVSISAGTDAAEISLSSAASVDVIAGWYRRALPLNNWQIKNDGKGRDGVVTLYAEKEGRPLWITLRPNAAGSGTSYTLIGALTDTAAVRPD